MAAEEIPAPIPTSSSSLFGIDTTMLTLFYQDLAQPGVKQVGLALGTVFELSNIFIQPLKFYSEKKKLLYAKHLEDFRKKLEDIPEENVIEVAPELGVPILENLGKTTSEKVSELYLNLLTNASSIDFVAHTHPRFVSIIENITTDEVRILEFLDERKRVPFINIIMTVNYGRLRPDIAEIFRSKTGFGFLHERATMLEKIQLLSLPDKARFYFQNLEGLGLLRGDTSGVALGDAYDTLLESFNEVLSTQLVDGTISVDKGSFELTETGKLFLLACKPPPKV